MTALAAAGVFVFARPEYHPRYESKMIDFSEQEYLAPASVRAAFAANGVTLYRTEGSAGIVLFSNRRGAVPAAALQVAVARRDGRGSWGPELEADDERFGNVLVTYGGDDERLLDRVRGAVEDLR